MFSDFLSNGKSQSKSLLQKVKIRFDSFTDSQKPIAKLGEGGFGTAYKVTLMDGTKYVVKQMHEGQSFTLNNFAKEIAPFHFLGVIQILLSIMDALKIRKVSGKLF